MGGVDVLDEGELPASGTTLAGGDGRGGQEVFPDLKSKSLVKCSKGMIREESEIKENHEHTLNHLFPYLASTLSLLPIQLRYHLHRVAE